MTEKEPRTFADMTATEIDNCVGMWCNCDDNEGNIYLYIFQGMRGKNAIFTTPGAVQGGGGPGWTLPDFGKLITPRFDLPRAWRSNGLPPTGHWEHETTEISQYSRPQSLGITNRRWVGSWESLK